MTNFIRSKANMKKLKTESESKLTDKEILDFFSMPHLRINKDIMKAYGVSEAIWIADIFSRWNYFKKKGMLDEDDFFFVSQPEIRKTTQLNYNKQTDIINKFSADGAITVKRKGLPARNFYRINLGALIKKTNEKLVSIKKTNEKPDSSYFEKKDLDPYNLQNLKFYGQGTYNKNKRNKNNSNKKLSSKEDKVPKEPESLPDKKRNNNPHLMRSDYPPIVGELIDHWNGLKIVQHKDETNTMDKILPQLNTKSQQYKPEEIKQAMTKYKELLENPGSRLYNRRGPFIIGLDQFFKFGKFTKTNGYKELENVNSWFEECLKKDLSHLMKIPKDENPEVTEVLKTKFMNRIRKFDYRDEKAFIEGSSMLVKFLERNKSKIRYDERHYMIPKFFTEMLIMFLEEENNNGSEVHPGWCKTSFELGTFPKWLYDTNRVIEGKILTKVWEG